MSENKQLLKSINSPDNIKKMGFYHLNLLAGEIRDEIINKVSANGGHLASNLGAVELTMALHKVFDSPKDKIIWDVGHQCYTHKLLTGRRKQFSSIRLENGISGFPKRSESPHDIIDTGHSSTSISSAIGLLTGDRLQNRNNKVIAVIGDGALTGGMAFEGMNYAGHAKKDLIIVINDNKMSISPNVGAISSTLSRATMTRQYQTFRDTVDRAVETIPFIGKLCLRAIRKIKKAIKAVLYKDTLFSDFGFEYVGPIDGHNLHVLCNVFENIRTLNAPVVVHAVTNKGQGYKHAEGNPSKFHGISPFSIVDGKVEKKQAFNFTNAFSNSLMEAAADDKSIVAITAAMESGTGLSALKERFPKRFFDVGITEQHAVTFAAGLALSGLKPVVAIYSTFMQRAVDQVIHDACLQQLPIVFCMDRAGLVPSDGETHQGVFDICQFKSVPNLQLLAPATSEEMMNSLDYAFTLGRPVMIRYPKAKCSQGLPGADAPFETGKGVFLCKRQFAQVLLVTTGGLLHSALEASEQLSQNGINCDVYNLRFLNNLDMDYFESITQKYTHVYCIEDGFESGGIGETIAAELFKRRSRAGFHYRGIPAEFPGQMSRKRLLQCYKLDAESIRDSVLSYYTDIQKDKTAGETPDDSANGMVQ